MPPHASRCGRDSLSATVNVLPLWPGRHMFRIRGVVPAIAVPADQDQTALRPDVGGPRTDIRTIGKHMRGLESEPSVIAREMADTFCSQEVPSLFRQNRPGSVTEPAHVKRLVKGQADDDTAASWS